MFMDEVYFCLGLFGLTEYLWLYLISPRSYSDRHPNEKHCFLEYKYIFLWVGNIWDDVSAKLNKIQNKDLSFIKCIWINFTYYIFKWQENWLLNKK